jgi:hypothetical protein
MGDGMTVLCPRCGINEYTPYGERWDGPQDGPPPPALSRTTRGEEDEPVYVCSDCGQEEGMQDFFEGGAAPQSEWPLRNLVRHPAFGIGTEVRRPEGLRGPYGTNEGDKWLATGSDVQNRLDADGEGLVLIHEVIDGEEKLYTTALPDLIAEATAGHREWEAEQAGRN